MRSGLAVALIVALFQVAGASAQTGRAVTGVGQTKPPTRDASPPATGAPSDALPASAANDDTKTEEQNHAELLARIRRADEARRARDRASDELMARWEFAVCVGCGPSLKPFRRVWTNPVRVLAGISASADDKRQARSGARWTLLVMR